MERIKRDPFFDEAKAINGISNEEMRSMLHTDFGGDLLKMKTFHEQLHAATVKPQELAVDVLRPMDNATPVSPIPMGGIPFVRPMNVTMPADKMEQSGMKPSSVSSVKEGEGHHNVFDDDPTPYALGGGLVAVLLYTLEYGAAAAVVAGWSILTGLRFL